MNTPDTEGSVEELMRDLRHLASPYAETLSDMQRTSQFILLVNRLDKAMRTPDTEFDSDKEVVGSDCLCVLGSKKHNPECEYATPDTEWENEFDEKFSEFRYENVPDDMDVPIVYVKDFIRNLRTRRDTYWKERVRKEVEDMSHNIKIEIAGISGILNGSAVSDSGQAHTAQMKLGNILEALDTLLDNMK